MSTKPYPYNRPQITRYEFYSKGAKGTIPKIVEFTPLDLPGMENIGFGDIQENGSVSDLAESNNGDLLKVFSTVVQ
jgi:hypothetical protein